MPNDGEQEEYEEIDTRPLTPSQIGVQVTIKNNINSSNLLKRSVIPTHLEREDDGPPLPPRSYKSQPNLRNSIVNNSELASRLRHQELYTGVPDDDDGGEGEGYEEIEFTTDVSRDSIVGLAWNTLVVISTSRIL